MHGDVASAIKDYVRSVRIDVEIELGSGRDVAWDKSRTAHEHDILHIVDKGRFHDDSERYVGQRSNRADCHLTRVRHDGIDQEVHGMLAVILLRRLGKDHSAQTVLSMDAVDTAATHH